MNSYEVTATIEVSIPVLAEDEDEALDIALGVPLQRHLADGNYEVGNTKVEKT